MGRIIQISHDVYEELKRLKRDRSFSEILREMIAIYKEKQRINYKDLMKKLERIEKICKKKKKENISERINELLWQ